MRRLICLLSIPLIMLALAGCQSVDRGAFGPFKRSLNTTPHGYAVIADPTGLAPTHKVERFEVRPGECGSNSGWNDCETDRERSELSERGARARAGSTWWYGWSLYVPEDHPNVYPTKLALGQFHQERSKVMWMFQNGSGGYHLDGRKGPDIKLIDAKDMRGRWHRIEVNARWSRGEDGFLKVWVDGAVKVDYRGQTMTADRVYFKYGVYRSFMSRYKLARGASEVPAQTALYANVRKAKTREGLRPPGN